MSKPDKHSRRDFLQGKAAIRVAADKAQELIDSASELIDSRLPDEAAAHIIASRRAMACEFAIQYHDSDDNLAEAVLSAFDLIESIEDSLTIYRDESDVIDINRRAAEGPVGVSDDLFQLLQLSERLHRDTAGAFDITSGPLSRTWGFLRRDGRVPEPGELAAALAIVDGSSVELDQSAQTVQFRDADTEINFNSIGKGYALDRVADFLDLDEHSDYLWHGGGSSVLARGKNRSSKSASWTVGLRHPIDTSRRIAEFHLSDRALATAGGATQFFEHEGKRYSHILDPRTGWPACEIISATVLAPTAAEADGLATAFFVMGRDQAEAYCEQHPEICAVLVCPATNTTQVSILPFGLMDHDWTVLCGS